MREENMPPSQAPSKPSSTRGSTHPHITAGTPGRINALVRDKHLRLAALKHFIGQLISPHHRRHPGSHQRPSSRIASPACRSQAL
ncbi:hypothetical protein P154DRAFT_618341 [Amniculicola lignicola CBS 123094]|uniref:Uncharacterized protein n=1 Tax=Amniculicola lignicola CBS 123094 TaxID=1392246 RepID=A0A6A5WKW4_9PLEO|nr:hypothetical protein P154DRAFT_618341 [Amniculicola lignicola CBS 123094]